MHKWRTHSIRIAALTDSSLAARKLAPNRRVVCASPEYLRRHGAPRTPDDLAQHNCLLAMEFNAAWEHKGPDGKPGSVRVAGRYVCDNWEVLRAWALLPGYSFDSDVAIYAVYPHRRHLPAKPRAFIDFLASSFGPEPFWERGVAVKPRIKARAAA